MNIPIKIYLYTILFAIFLILGISIYLYISPNNSQFIKIFIVWYAIILEINLIHLYFIMKFYEKHKNKKGIKGPIGDKGPRGFKGNNERCSSCGPSLKSIFAGNINDKGQNVIDRADVNGGKCVFPFIHNYEYKYNCLKEPPPGEEDNDANMFGWCGTELDENHEVKKYGYCNENESIHDKLKKEKQYLDNRAEYMNNNYGILDVNVVSGNTETDAKKNCNKMGQDYRILKNKKSEDQDLNEGVDGKFLYMCYKQGYGNLGVNQLKVFPDNNSKRKTMDNKKYELIDVNLNEGSKDTGQSLYLYKNMSNSNFIKNLELSKEKNKIGDGWCNKEYAEIKYFKDDNDQSPTIANLNEPDETNKIVLCEKRTHTLDGIDMAFIYNHSLYIFRDHRFYKMSNVPSQNYIKVIDGFPKKISERWFSGDECSRFNAEPECNQQEKCLWSDKEGSCDHMGFSAAFVYGFDKKTYFFRGSKVYLYDDKNLKVAEGYPKEIKTVFKGVPSNIDAAFTWGKDGKTYFFKGPLYYKYNDKKKTVEKGYPKKTKDRWFGMPTIIDAIFTLNVSLDNKNDRNPTYIISGGHSYYIDPSTDNISEKNKKTIDERFKGLAEAYIEKTSKK